MSKNLTQKAGYGLAALGILGYIGIKLISPDFPNVITPEVFANNPEIISQMISYSKFTMSSLGLATSGIVLANMGGISQLDDKLDSLDRKVKKLSNDQNSYGTGSKLTYGRY